VVCYNIAMLESPEINHRGSVLEEELTLEDWAELKSGAQALYERVLSYPISENHFSHITRNLATPISPDAIEREARTSNPERYKFFSKVVDSLSRYFALIDEHPDFKEAEARDLYGMFPDLEDLQATQAVQEMEKKLTVN
jgi:hypothetical protein